MSALSNVASLVGWKGYAAAVLAGVVVLAGAGAWVFWYGASQYPVSYTHLTLPTIYSV